jgi:hypothetical protein
MEKMGVGKRGSTNKDTIYGRLRKARDRAHCI